MKPFKRRAAHASDPMADQSKPTNVFKQFFESQFQPLEPQLLATTNVNEQTLTDDNSVSTSSGWEGFSSDSEGPSSVEVVEHVQSQEPRSASSQDVKAPTVSEIALRTRNDELETMNLKNDLDLQRLLKESHLLDSGKSTELQGLNRHHAVDMRLLDLGAKTSILEHEKMPLAHRKGIQAKNRARGYIQRVEAQRNGIILEKPTLFKKASTRRRVREVGAPGVGKLSGATLKLSRKDLESLQSPRSPKVSKRARR